MRNALKTSLKLYGGLSSLVVSLLLCILLSAVATGFLNAGRLDRIREAILGKPGDSSIPRKEETAVAAAPKQETQDRARTRMPGEVLQEIERASQDLRMWEDRIDILGRDLGRRLLTVGEKDQSIQEHQRAWDRVRKSMVPLLNRLLADTPGWKPITEDEFLSAITGELSGEGGNSRTLVDILEGLERREAAFAGGARALKGLDPKVLAGILSAGLKPPAEGGAGAVAGTTKLTGEQAVRLLISLDPSKLARVFKALADDDPACAATLTSLVLKESERRLAKTSGPSGAEAGGEGTGEDRGGENRG